MTGDPRTREHPFSPMPGSRCAECNGYADEHGLLDADPDAPTHCANCGQHVRPNAPHKLGECNPDDAPADTDLSETLARHLQVAMTETGFMPDITYCREIAAILVAAEPWRAQVEAARRDTLNQATCSASGCSIPAACERVCEFTQRTADDEPLVVQMRVLLCTEHDLDFIAGGRR